MDLLEPLRLMAHYNQWMNRRLYALLAGMGDGPLQEPRGAFFGSLFGTATHVVVADILWLQRFARHPAGQIHLAAVAAMPTPVALDARPWPDLVALTAVREPLDHIILNWVQTLTVDALSVPLSYHNSRGEPFTRSLHLLLTHFFNHQTHHRGQLTTLLSQMGCDPGVTDLLALIPVQASMEDG